MEWYEIEKLGNDFLKFVYEDDNNCWNWSGSFTTTGAPRLYVNRRAVQAKRYAYDKCIGSVYKISYMINLCGNSKCVNPSHHRVDERKNKIESLANELVEKEKSINPYTGRYSRSYIYKEFFKITPTNNNISEFLTRFDISERDLCNIVGRV